MTILKDISIYKLSLTEHCESFQSINLQSLQWRQNGRYGFSNHQSRDCLLNCLFRRRPKKNSKLRVTGLCEGNSPVNGDFPYKGRLTRKIFHFDEDIIGTLKPMLN